MIFVCDTHAFVWWVTGKRSLGPAAARAFRRAERRFDEIRLPAVSLFQVALLLERGRLRSRPGWEGWPEAVQSTPGLAVEPLGANDVAYARDLVALVDPFDRLIAATALRLDVPLITTDERITTSRVVQIVW